MINQWFYIVTEFDLVVILGQQKGDSVKKIREEVSCCKVVVDTILQVS